MAERGRGRRYSEIAVLYRINSMARNLEQALRSLDIPYRVFGGQSFFERKEVRDFLAYCKIALDPHDRMALLRIINTPNRGIGLKTLEKICEVADRQHVSLFTAISEHNDQFTSSARKHLEQFVSTCNELAKFTPVNVAQVEQLGLNIIRTSGLDREIRLKNTDANAQQKKLQSLRSLPAWL
jgi:DNA helicase-2/ATP-dependent DNA helicase PcrA